MEELVDKIIKYEEGQMTESEVAEFFQELYNKDIWKSLQGHYGKVMTSLINDGRIKTRSN